MRIICPRCHHVRQKRRIRRYQRVTCTKCGAVATYQGRAQGFIWEFPQEPESRETNSEWVLPTYLDAKVAAIARQIEPGNRFPTCPICGNAAVAGHCHHVWLSQRFKIAKCDLRNIIIVCNPTYANCHDMVHGSAKSKVRQALYLLLGQGSLVAGAQIIQEARQEWFRHSR